MTLALFVYNFLLFLGAPVWVPLVIWRNLRRGRPLLGGGFSAADAASLRGTKVVWLHAVSMGESLVGVALYRRLAPLLPGFSWVFTTTTPT
ncbi:MAG: 3-deoxy-D-manno-octulosonic acid transferase, partial [Firmicutes bacterium]|nr:3-deoxy-D-manno-octulosonic acid transferase [Bacillota bacterium]